MTLKQFKKAYPWILTALTLLCGVCYIVAVCHLYFTGGDTPYSRSSVGYYLLWLIAPSVLLFVGCIYGYILHQKEGRPYVQKPIDKAMPLAIIRGKMPLAVCDEQTASAVTAERKRRVLLLAIAGGVSVLCAVPALLVALNGELYSLERLNGSIISICVVVLPLAAVALGAWVAVSLLCMRSEERELALLRKAAASPAKANVGEAVANKPSPLEEKREVIIFGARVAVLLTAVVFIIVGVLNGGMNDVLAKAVKICTECIGLG